MLSDKNPTKDGHKTSPICPSPITSYPTPENIKRSHHPQHRQNRQAQKPPNRNSKVGSWLKNTWNMNYHDIVWSITSFRGGQEPQGERSVQKHEIGRLLLSIITDPRESHGYYWVILDFQRSICKDKVTVRHEIFALRTVNTLVDMMHSYLRQSSTKPLMIYVHSDLSWGWGCSYL
jgi:hypothetical protein